MFKPSSTDSTSNPNALEGLATTLSNAVRLLNNIPASEKFTKADRQNAAALLARIYPEQLRAPISTATNDRDRGGANDEGCIAVTPERKYYEFNDVFIRRSLEPHEWVYNVLNEVAVPHIIEERMMNDVLCSIFVRQNTSIPVPKVLAAFHDNGRYYIIQERVEGIQLARLQSEADRQVVMKEVEGYVEVLHRLRSKRMGGVSGIISLPDRVARVDTKRVWNFRESEEEDFVFCHNDLSQYNILVDPETLKITAVLDWEYAGFYPEEFEGRFYKWPGCSAVLEGEEDDVPKLLETLEKWAI
ncbi:kinase-like protein [Schizopora paradoxa]|uniref:Kinase-like protein n=1 Tax=Schizopora paradoxa TaxID=27342 RepID=A0A0H2SAA7_9AGAM|nr:kinase-like protein [Schizopora paradoxa]